MPDTTAYLAMYLEGPMQAWGYSSRYGRRTTLSYPTRSGLIGLLMAALGAPRDDTKTVKLLNGLAFEVFTFKKEGVQVQRWVDYHTVGGGYDSGTERSFIPPKADGKGTPQTVLTTREYLADACFGAIVTGPKPLLDSYQVALLDPVWGLWLGRKTCIPTARIGRGVHDDRLSALEALSQESSGVLVRSVKEVDTFEDGTDSLMDAPIDFENRVFTQRRVADLGYDVDSEG